MRINTTRASLGLLLCGLLGVASCQSMNHSSSSTKPSTSTATAAEKPKPIEASAPKSSVAVGMLRSSLAFPTGNEKTSALLLEKTAPREVMAGQDFNYEILVTNLTEMTLENVMVTEALPSNFQMNSAQPSPAAKKVGEGSWNLGSLAPFEARSIEVRGVAREAGSVSTCSTVAYNTGMCMNIPVVKPALQLLATGTTNHLSCEPATFKYVVSNPGSGTARDVVVNATLPSGLKTTDGRTTISKSIGDLESGESKNFSVKVNASKTGRFEHKATAAAKGGLKADSSVVATQFTKPILSITKTGSKKQFAGRTLKYEIKVSNTGDGVARDLVIEDVLPMGTKFRSASDGGKLTAGRVKWLVSSLAPKASKTFNLSLQADEIGRLVNTATAVADCAAPVKATLETEIAGIPAILMEVVDVADPIEVGENATYVVTITNQGSAAATNVKIACQLPPNVEFVSAKGSTSPLAGMAGEMGNVTFSPKTSLAPKAEASWTIVVRGTKSADARFKVSLTSDQLTSPVEETEATNYYE